MDRAELNPNPEERRRAPRYPTRLDALLLNRGDPPQTCRILDINQYGCRLELDGPSQTGSFYIIDLAGAVAYKARPMWSKPPLTGTRFLECWSLASPDAPAWLIEARGERMRLDAQERGIRLVWSAPVR
jgi:hypothetical protein